MDGHDATGGLTRRTLLGRAAVGGAALMTGEWRTRGASAATPVPGALPTPAAFRRDVTRMVDFGPRLCGTPAHEAYVRWLERGFLDAGCTLRSCEEYTTKTWEPGPYGLEILDGTGAGRVDVGAFFPRCRPTGPDGVVGPLVAAGPAPAPAENATSIADLKAGLARYGDDLASWARALPAALAGATAGAILVIDLPVPVPATPGIIAPLFTFYNGQGETTADLLTEDYKRFWLVPGLALPLAEFAALGVAGVVLVVDASAAALKDQYMPFEWIDENVPAVFVDRDTGRTLRERAATRPRARLTVTATRRERPIASVTAVLPGASDETIIFNTHTDGQGFVEENGGVAFVHLARHFAARPLRRTVVFAAWPGHMSNNLPQATGWIEAHPDLVGKAAAALTVEHLGCSEWTDSVAHGYHATGRAELFLVWTTQGAMGDAVRAATVAHDLPRTGLARPPIQFGVGGPFEVAGIPEIGAIAGPEYLLTMSANGELDKLDEALAARQIAWLADVARRLDAIPAAELRRGDPTLGAPSTMGNVVPSTAKPHAAACRPADGDLVVRWYGRRHALGGARVALSRPGEPLTGVTVELRRDGRLLARSRPVTVTAAPRDVVLRRAGRRRFPAGRCSLVVRHGATVLARRPVHLGR